MVSSAHGVFFAVNFLLVVPSFDKYRYFLFLRQVNAQLGQRLRVLVIDAQSVIIAASLEIMFFRVNEKYDFAQSRVSMFNK